MSDLFLPPVVGMRKGIVECLAINILGMAWQVITNRTREVSV